MEFVSAVLITLACISVSYYVWNRIFGRSFIKEINLPSPKNALKHFLSGTPDESLDVINLLARIYPSPFQISLNSTPFIVIYEPSQVKTVLQSRRCLEKTVFYKFVKSVFGVGLLTAPASIWAENRQIIASNFNPNTLQEFFNTFVEQSLILINKLEKVGQDGNEIIFFEHIKRRALDIACDAMVGIKINSNKKNQYFKAVVRLKEILSHRLYSWIYNKFFISNVIFNLTALGREQRKIIKLMNSLIVEDTLQELYGSNELRRIEMNKTHKTFINNLMKVFWKKNFTKESIIDNVLTLIFTASDTISVTLDFTVFMLANFPEIQEKVYKELEEIYGTKTPISAPIKYDDLQHMHYLDRVLKETMRLFPAIPIIGRELTEDMKIGETIFPKNSNIIIAFMRMYRNEEYMGPNPLKFDPDRFLPERIKDCLSFYYIPFSDGPRNCIGINYAMNSMKVILATLVRTFVFKVDKYIEINEIKLKADIILSPIEPLKIRIEKRNI